MSDNFVLRAQLWDTIADCAVQTNADEALVDRIFADITAVIRQRTGWTLEECELLFADAKNRAMRAVDQAEENDALLIKVGDAIDAIVELLAEEDQP